MLNKLQKLVKKAMNWHRPCSYIVYVMVMAIAVAIPIGIALFCSSCFGYTMGNLGSLGDFFGGISAVLAILVTYCIFISQQRLSYKIGLNASFSEMLRTLKEIGVSNRDQVNNSKAAILNHFTHINNEKTNELDPDYLAKAYHFYFERHISHEPGIMHFLQYFAQVFKRITDDKELKTIQEKNEYIHLLAAQMTEEELFIVFFSYLSGDRIVNELDFSEYSFFEYLKTNNWFLDDKKVCLFPQTKFVFICQKPNINDIDTGETEYNNEQIYETIDRIKNEEQKKTSSI